MEAEIYPSGEEGRKVVRKVENPMDNEDTDSCVCMYVRFGWNLRTLDSMFCLYAIFSQSLYFNTLEDRFSLYKHTVVI